MAKGFKHGGGGAGFNFRVLGGTAATSSPKENDIWVNTDVSVSSWAFSDTEPQAEEGMVWITTGASSSVPFNALKKNSIMAYPLSASQYIDGAWVKKSASMYKNGGWTVFSVAELYLYNVGDACTADSGGWSLTSNSGQQAMKLSKGSSYMTVSSTWSANYTSHATCGTGKKVNVTNYSKLNVLYDFSATVTTMEGAGDSYAKLSFGLGTSDTSVSSASVSGSKGTNKTASLDISSLKTSLYVVAKLQTYGKDGNINLKIRKVWLS